MEKKEEHYLPIVKLLERLINSKTERLTLEIEMSDEEDLITTSGADTSAVYAVFLNELLFEMQANPDWFKRFMRSVGDPDTDVTFKKVTDSLSIICNLYAMISLESDEQAASNSFLLN